MLLFSLILACGYVIVHVVAQMLRSVSANAQAESGALGRTNLDQNKPANIVCSAPTNEPHLAKFLSSDHRVAAQIP